MELAILIGLQAAGKKTFYTHHLRGYAHIGKDLFSAREATRELERTSVSAKNEVLYARGINVNDVPAWQRRGVGLWWERYEKTGRAGQQEDAATRGPSQDAYPCATRSSAAPVDEEHRVRGELLPA